MFFPIAFVFATLLGEVLGTPLTNGAAGLKKKDVSHKLHERHLPGLSKSWVKRSKVYESHVLPMRIGLKQRNLEAGHDKLMELSTPGSGSYGKHMTPEEVIHFFAPHEDSTSTVLHWLQQAGFTEQRVSVSVNKQWVQFDATAAEAEELLLADFFVWEHASSGKHDISTEEYHVPAYVQEHIDYVTPGTRLRQGSLKMESMKKRSNTGGPQTSTTELQAFPQPNSSTCDVYVTAECTRVQYDIPNATTAAPGNELGIYEALGQHYSRADLDIYFSTLYPEIPNGTYPIERLVDGAFGAFEDSPSPSRSGINLEPPLDFDSSWPLIYPQQLVLFQVDDEVHEKNTTLPRGFFNTFLDAIDGSYCTYSAFGETGDCTDRKCFDPQYPDPNPGGYKGQLQCGVYKPTNVISISYGTGESFLPDYYLKRQCNEWMKLGLQGVTVLVSSGDDGVGHGNLCEGKSGKIFDVDYPSSCPYVLSVGSTEWVRFNNSSPVPGEKLMERATTRFPSGGGFSNVFGIPSYQRTAVDAYFDEVDLGFAGYHHYVSDANFSSVTGGVYHHGGRAYPDVGAIGDRQLVYSDPSWWLVGGTSLSTPVWGAMLTLVNEERIAAGKSTVGFIHPVLYAHPEIFNDITIGSNPGCNSTGFLAAKGWDPVTGLGSPNFPKLLEVLMAI